MTAKCASPCERSTRRSAAVNCSRTSPPVLSWTTVPSESVSWRGAEEGAGAAEAEAEAGASAAEAEGVVADGRVRWSATSATAAAAAEARGARTVDA